MYGFIYNTLRNLVVEKFGEEKWIEICNKAGVEELKEAILDRHYYDENYLGAISMEATKVLGLTLEQILESFGAFFFLTCKKSGHSSLLRTLGHNLHGFLMNLDALHDHLSFTYNQMRAPSFRCEKTPTGLILHYYSYRPQLSRIVVGIVKAVAKDFYELDVKIEEVSYEHTGDKLAHHYVFYIEVEDWAKDEHYLERLSGVAAEPNETVEEVNEPDLKVTSAVGITPVIDEDEDMLRPVKSCSSGRVMLQIPDDQTYEKKTAASSSFSDFSRIDHGTSLKHPANFISSTNVSARFNSMGFSRNWPITPTLFQSCFPFHVIFDHNLVIRFMGIALNRIFPRAVVNGALLTDYFQLNRPAIALTYLNIRENLHNIFIMSTKDRTQASTKEALQFRGQMMPTSSQEPSNFLFLASPRVESVEELETQGLYLSDIPIHDVTRDLILLNRHFRVEMNIAAELEQTKKDLQLQKSYAEREKQRADQLLHAMLPPSIASQLKRGVEASATDYPSVTILFSDIKGFTTICNSCHPMQVVGMLNTLYTRFDGNLEKHNVYKVETIGDAYMVAAGLLDTAKEHALAICSMAFDMMEEASKVMEPNNQTTLQIRIGIHSGPVVAGVVGRKMPRFCLFGDTVNTASRMESHGEPGRIHVSDVTYTFLKGNSKLRFYSRGKIEVKGLGEKQTYFVEAYNPDIPCPEQISAHSLRNSSIQSFTFTEFNQCNLVKLPPLTRNPVSSSTSSPFSSSEGESGIHKPQVIDMIKPQPLEEAWTKSEEEKVCTDSEVTLPSISGGKGGLRENKVSPLLNGSEDLPPTALPPPEGIQSTRRHRKLKCIIA